MSSLWTCKTTLSKTAQISSHIFSSHSKSVRCHLHPPPLDSKLKNAFQPQLSLYSSLTQKAIQTSHKMLSPPSTHPTKKRFGSVPTSRTKLLSNQLSTIPHLIAPICFHHADARQPTSPTLPPTTSYLAVKTLNHKLSCFTCILQQHFHNNAKLNSIMLHTPKPSFSFDK